MTYVGVGSMRFLCKCNHKHRYHWKRGGPCIAGKKNGKPCACSRWRPRDNNPNNQRREHA